MNTKTTKFLAVLAVLAMAFAVIVTAPSVSATDYTNDLASHADTDLEGLTVWYNDTSKSTDHNGTGLEMTVDGDRAYFVGTAYTPNKESTYFADLPYGAYMGLSAFAIPSDVTNVQLVITDNAFKMTSLAAVGADGKVYRDLFSAAQTSVEKITSGKITFSAVAKANLTTLLIPIPTDGSAVSVKVYAESTSGDLLYDLVLDFSETYTKVALSNASVDTAQLTGWTYTHAASTSGTLVLSDYCGNENFYFENNTKTIVSLTGDNVMGGYIVGGTEKSPVTVNDIGVIKSKTALTIQDADATTPSASNISSLSISMTIDDNVNVLSTTASTPSNVPQIAAIFGSAGVSIYTDALAIDVDGYIQTYKDKTATILEERNTVAGIHSPSAFVVAGSAKYPVIVDISVCETSPAAMGIYAAKADISYVKGEMSAGNRALHIEGASTIKGCDLDLYGNESGIKARAATLEIDSSTLDITIVGYELFNAGDNVVAGLSLTKAATLTLINKTVINTMGMYVAHPTISEEIASVTLTSGIINVTGDYEQNENSDIADYVVAGLSYYGSNASSIAVYNATPKDTAVTSYIKVVGDTDYIGAIGVKNADGQYVSQVITDASKLADLTSYTTSEVVYANLTSPTTMPSAVTVPSWMTLVLTVTGTAQSTAVTFTAGAQTFTIDASGFVGTISINKDGMIVDGATTMKLSDVAGDLILSGTINAANNAIFAKDKVLAITLADGFTLSNSLTIKGSQTTVTVPLGAEAKIGAELTIAKDTGSAAVKTALVIDGQVTQTAGGSIVLSNGTATIAGALAGYQPTASAFLNMANGTSAIISGIIGYNETSKTFNTVTVGYAATSAFTACNVIAGTTPITVSVASEKATIAGDIAAVDSDVGATIDFSQADSTGLTIGKKVTATADAANDLEVSGAMSIAGTFTSMNLGLVVGDSAVSTLTVSGKLIGAFQVGETELSIKVNEKKQYVTGLTFETVKVSSSEYDAVISGNLSVNKVNTTASDNNTAFLEVTKGTLKVKDNTTLNMAKYTGISVKYDESNPGVLKGSVTGPDSASATFNAAAGDDVNEDGYTVIAGSLTIAGVTAKDDTITEISITGGTVTASGLTAGKVEVGTGSDAELFIPSPTTTTMTTLVVGEKATVENNGTLTPATATVAAGATINALITNATYEDGTTIEYQKTPADPYDVYLLTMKKVGDKTYAFGAKELRYTGTGASPLTDDALVIYAADITAIGTDLGATAVIKSGASVKDEVNVYEDAITVTIPNVGSYDAPVKVAPALVKIVLDYAGLTTTAVNENQADGKDLNDSTGWTDDSASTIKTLTRYFEISDKTSIFGVLPYPTRPTLLPDRKHTCSTSGWSRLLQVPTSTEPRSCTSTPTPSPSPKWSSSP